LPAQRFPIYIWGDGLPASLSRGRPSGPICGSWRRRRLGRIGRYRGELAGHRRTRGGGCRTNRSRAVCRMAVCRSSAAVGAPSRSSWACSPWSPSGRTWCCTSPMIPRRCWTAGTNSPASARSSSARPWPLTGGGRWSPAQGRPGVSVPARPAAGVSGRQMPGRASGHDGGDQLLKPGHAVRVGVSTRRRPMTPVLPATSRGHQVSATTMSAGKLGVAGADERRGRRDGRAGCGVGGRGGARGPAGRGLSEEQQFYNGVPAEIVAEAAAHRRDQVSAE
jgi:hypothetical protein